MWHADLVHFTNVNDLVPQGPYRIPTRQRARHMKFLRPHRFWWRGQRTLKVDRVDLDHQPVWSHRLNHSPGTSDAANPRWRNRFSIAVSENSVLNHKSAALGLTSLHPVADRASKKAWDDLRVRCCSRSVSMQPSPQQIASPTTKGEVNVHLVLPIESKAAITGFFLLTHLLPDRRRVASKER